MSRLTSKFLHVFFLLNFFGFCVCFFEILWIITLTQVCQGSLVVVASFLYHNKGNFFVFFYVRYYVMGWGMMREVVWNAAPLGTNKCTKDIIPNGHQVVHTIKWGMMIMGFFEWTFWYFFIGAWIFWISLFFVSFPLLNLLASYLSLYEKACSRYWAFHWAFILHIFY